jgi:aconitase A
VGLWFSKPGNGVSHPVHMQRFGVPGKTLLGSDSHTCAAGSLGMLAIGAGGLDVALAMAGEPYHVKMPEIWGVRLVGELPDWVSAKDVILEQLRRHEVDGGYGRIIEYHGPGLEHLSAMDRHVSAVIAKSFARIHGQNLVNFGVAPLLLCDPVDHDAIEAGDVLRIDDLHGALSRHAPIDVANLTRERTFQVRHDLSERQLRVLFAGGLINDFRQRKAHGVTPR